MKYALTAAYLRRQRLDKGYTQEELQKFIGYAGKNGFVSRVEQGKVMYSGKILRKLMKRLCLDKEILIQYYGVDVCENARRKLLRSITPR